MVMEINEAKLTFFEKFLLTGTNVYMVTDTGYPLVYNLRPSRRVVYLYVHVYMYVYVYRHTQLIGILTITRAIHIN